MDIFKKTCFDLDEILIEADYTEEYIYIYKEDSKGDKSLICSYQLNDFIDDIEVILKTIKKEYVLFEKLKEDKQNKKNNAKHGLSKVETKAMEGWLSHPDD